MKVRRWMAYSQIVARAMEMLSLLYLVRIFRTCVSIGSALAIWQQVKLLYIPKLGTNYYNRPWYFRRNCLTSFLLKTKERLVDSYLRDEAPILVPLHPNQQAYQAGKSFETACHRVVVRVGKVLDRRETALCVLLRIEEAFNNTCYDNMCDVLSDMGVIIALCVGIGPHCRVQQVTQHFQKRLRECLDKRHYLTDTVFKEWIL